MAFKKRKEEIMTKQTHRITWCCAAIVTLFVAGIASAQQKYPFINPSAPQSSRYVQQQIIDVGDIPGHQIRIYEIQRMYTADHPVIMGTKVVEVWARGSADYVNGVGPAQGYDIMMLEDGSKIFAEWRGTSYSEATSTGSRRGTFHGTIRWIGGTGKYATIRGVITAVSEFDTDPKTGYNRTVHKGEYWFEK
jgi:hypothetical protein